MIIFLILLIAQVLTEADASEQPPPNISNTENYFKPECRFQSVAEVTVTGAADTGEISL